MALTDCLLHLLFVIFFVFSNISFSFSFPYWASGLINLPSTLSLPALATINQETLYLFGGYTDDNIDSPSFLIYKYNVNTPNSLWITLDIKLPNKTYCYQCTAVINNRFIYIITQYLNTFYIFDTFIDNFISTEHIVAPPKQIYGSYISVTTNNQDKIYITSYSKQSIASEQTYLQIYSTTNNNWFPTRTFPYISHGFTSSTYYNDIIYVFAGYIENCCTGSNCDNNYCLSSDHCIPNQCELNAYDHICGYKLTTFRWECYNTSLSQHKYGASIIIYPQDEQIYLIGGYSGNPNDPTYSSAVDIFNINNNKITETESLPNIGGLVMSTVLNNELLIFGGRNISSNANFYGSILSTNVTEAPKTFSPSAAPSANPTKTPTTEPTIIPTDQPSIYPSLTPTISPSMPPTIEPTNIPSGIPTFNPTDLPSAIPTFNPTNLPSIIPTYGPTVVPTELPTYIATEIPSIDPTELPSIIPTVDPTIVPTGLPTYIPTELPSIDPTVIPSIMPTFDPTIMPTEMPSDDPTVIPSMIPSLDPSEDPTISPTTVPSNEPTVVPTHDPSFVPTDNPTVIPTYIPTLIPSVTPTRLPTDLPSNIPTKSPSVDPTTDPTELPTNSPSINPTLNPTIMPTVDPTPVPTDEPSILPSLIPSETPTNTPSIDPTINPTSDPTTNPTFTPTDLPSNIPTFNPTNIPTLEPTIDPTRIPSDYPSNIPTQIPSQNTYFMNISITEIPKNRNNVADSINTLLSENYIRLIWASGVICLMFLTFSVVFLLYSTRKRLKETGNMTWFEFFKQSSLCLKIGVILEMVDIVTDALYAASLVQFGILNNTIDSYKYSFITKLGWIGLISASIGYILFNIQMIIAKRLYSKIPLLRDNLQRNSRKIAMDIRPSVTFIAHDEIQQQIRIRQVDIDIFGLIVTCFNDIIQITIIIVASSILSSLPLIGWISLLFSICLWFIHCLNVMADILGCCDNSMDIFKYQNTFTNTEGYKANINDNDAANLRKRTTISRRKTDNSNFNRKIVFERLGATGIIDDSDRDRSDISDRSDPSNQSDRSNRSDDDNLNMLNHDIVKSQFRMSLIDDDSFSDSVGYEYDYDDDIDIIYDNDDNDVNNDNDNDNYNDNNDDDNPKRDVKIKRNVKIKRKLKKHKLLMITEENDDDEYSSILSHSKKTIL